MPLYRLYSEKLGCSPRNVVDVFIKNISRSRIRSKSSNVIYSRVRLISLHFSFNRKGSSIKILYPISYTYEPYASNWSQLSTLFYYFLMKWLQNVEINNVFNFLKNFKQFIKIYYIKQFYKNTLRQNLYITSPKFIYREILIP